jgi:hypothetical protein
MTEDVIDCFSISSDYNCVCLVTRDNKLRLFSLPKLRPRRIIQLPKSAVKNIVISETWGWIIANFGRKFSLFNINGNFIAEFEHDVDIAYWNSISSLKDFDYIAFVDLTGVVVVVDCCDVKNKREIAKVVWSVVMIGYDRTNDCLVLVGMKGKMMIIADPFRFFG